MLRSSLGFHTITLSLPLFDNIEVWQLIANFLTYSPDSRKRDDEFSPHLAELPEFY